MPQEILRMQNIDKRFPGVHALNDVDFNINAGEIHALVGENGAGKSTLMNVLIGSVIPDKGTIEIEGVQHAVSSPSYAIRHGIGMVPQELNIIPEITVAENIFLGIPNKKHGVINWKETNRRSEALLKDLGCSIDVRSLAKSLNVAELQMVQIARALAFGAKIIILDEPTASLTLQESRALFAIIKRLKDNGAGIVYISHHMEEIMDLSDRVTVMRDGQVVANLLTSQTSVEDLISHMAGEEVVLKKSERKFSSNEVFLQVDGLCSPGRIYDISFEVYRGEIFGLGGLVGAGRSEVVQAIFGYVPVEKGSIRMDGQAIAPSSPNHAIAAGIGYVPEERRQQAIFPDLSIRENMTIPFLRRLIENGRISLQKQRAITEKYIEELNIKTTDGEKKIKELSGGNQQKVILGRWIAQDLKLLILDEPTRGIDVKAKGEIHNIVRRLADSGLTVIVVSSEMDELINICDRVLVMHEGHMKGIIRTEGITAKDILDTALS